MTQSAVTGVARALLLGAAATAIWAGSATAQSRIECGSDLYVVGPGDSLSAIAQRAYSSFNYQVIYEANRDVITNAAVLEVGQRLFIPCLDGSGARTKAEALGQAEPVLAAAPATAPANSPVTRQALQTDDPLARLEEQKRIADEDGLAEEAKARHAAVAEAAARAAEIEIVPVEAPEPAEETRVAALEPTGSVRQETPPADLAIRMLTGSRNAPYTDRDAPEGGMITELINRAIQRADHLRFYEITWDNDWSRHVAELLPEGRHDVGFPWFKPDCSRLDRLSAEMRARCTDYRFSQPLWEMVTGFYVLRDDAARMATEMSELKGRRVCRPEGSFLFDLEVEGLVEPDVTLVRPATVADCMAMLASGEVDVVSVNVVVGDREIEAQGLRSSVTEAKRLARTETLHAVAHRSNPYGAAYLGLIDDGLRQLREEGVWFEVTRRHMTEHAGIN